MLYDYYITILLILKSSLDLKAMIKALSLPISSFLNTDEDNKRLKRAKQELKRRKQ